MINGVRVLDRTTEIAGPYCTKLLADAGADVVKIGPPDGDPILRYGSGALFEYLNASKRVLTGGLADALKGADVVVTNSPEEARLLRRDRPELIVVCVTPFGMDGPWAGRPATEFTLQAACGSTGSRGDPDGPPLAAGGRIGEWITGTYAAVGAVAAIGIEGSPCIGRLVDVAMLDCMAVTLVTHPSVWASFAGWPPMAGTGRTVEVPSVEPTADGFAVFTTNSAQQFRDFLIMIGRADWLEDAGLAKVAQRFARRHEFLEGVRQYTRGRSTAAVLEDSGTFRIPAGPVLNGSTVPEFEQFVSRNVFVRSADGRFRQPVPPYRIGGVTRPEFGPHAGMPADDSRIGWKPRSVDAARPGDDRRLPLAGVRVIDCTAWWAGPSATHVLACLGADVVKVESTKRPDPMRTASSRPPRDPDWLEWSAIYHAANFSKRGVTLDLTTPQGVRLFERLAAGADVVVENYTPRVMEQFGLAWDRLHELNPRLIMVRMPAFGLDGPWRDRTGFAQTMECISGMAWVTGSPDGPPVLVRGACDPIAGMHAVFATFLALRARHEDGKGRLVEAPMVESALNVTAEQVIEWDVSGVLVDRQGARGQGAPQGVYRCAGDDRWVAISVVSDEQWDALRSVIGIPADARWATAEARRGQADDIDKLIEAWSATRHHEAVVGSLLDVGVPASDVVQGRDIVRNPQLRHRRLFETENHPVTGAHELPTIPFRFGGVEAWLSSPAPTLGQHNESVLSEVASSGELEELLSGGEPVEGPAGVPEASQR